MTKKNEMPALGMLLGDVVAASAEIGGARARQALNARLSAEQVASATAQFAADNADIDAESYRASAEERARNRRSRYEDARPVEYATASLDDLLSQQDPEGKGRGWLASGARIGLLMGPSGHGKTSLAYAIGNAACDAHMWVEAWSVAELVQALAPLPLHARRDETRSTRQENILGWAKECDLLILDDLGSEEAGGFVADRWRSQLLDILSARDGHPGRRTIVTANGGSTEDQATEELKAAVKIAAANGIADRYDARIATRLRRDMLGIWVEGECLRKIAVWNPFDSPNVVALRPKEQGA
jgi:DNA replication protein DnaC